MKQPTACKLGSVARHLTMAGFVLFAAWAIAPRPIAANMAEGNAAARAGDYEAALTQYERARRERGDSALLAFNRGVAQYRLGQYVEAEASFAKASQAQRLAPRAFYNLGLVVRAQGRSSDARIWFQQAASHPGASRELRTLAAKARRSLDGGVATGKRAPRRTPVEFGRDPERAIDFFDFGAATFVAMDSNVYRAPSSSYVDLAAPGTPVVQPDVQSASYVPVQLWAAAEWGRWDYSRFHLGYTFEGEFYLDSQFSNANRHSHVLRLANTYDRDTRIGRIYVASSFIAARFQEEAYDRDDGSSQSVLGEDVSDRFAFSHFGPRLKFNHDIGAFRWGLNAAATVSQFDETQPVVDYSHHQFTGGADVSYRLFGTTRFGVFAEYSAREYETYPARELDGSRFTLNPALEYRYTSYGAILRQRLTRRLWAAIDYRLTTREDEYVGYDDYQRHGIRARVELDMRRLTARLAYSYRDYSFDNAFAFDTPGAGEKTLTSTTAELDVDYRVWRALSVTALARLEMNDSSDPRLEYEQSQYALGVKWSM